MPYADKEKRDARDRQYYRENKEAIKKREREKYWRERSTIQGRRRELSTPERRAKAAERERLRYLAYRRLTISAYGGVCACCGESEPLFLELDHIQEDGRAHREQIGHSAKALVYWLLQHEFPDGFQVLCSNCNQGKKRNKGICPHKQIVR